MIHIKSIVNCVLPLAVLIQSTPLTAASAARAIESNTGKAAAPTQDDSAAYFAEATTGVSPEAAKEADNLRVKTMNSIKTLLEDKKNNRQEFELMLRLGELHIERADYFRDQEMVTYVKAYNTWNTADVKTRDKHPPTANYKNSESSLYNAVQVFRKLVAKFPENARTDAALFSLARTLGRLEDDTAVNYYKQLITNHPNSPLIPDAWLALGEFYFDKNQIKEATEAYQSVMNFKAHRAYPYAVYKLGWCYYNSQNVNESEPGKNLKKSITAFKLVVKLSEKTKNKNFNLRDEAIRDLVMAFAEAEDTEGAWAYFKEIGEEAKFYTMLERLGGLYADAGKNAKAIEVYTRLVTEAPNQKGNSKIYEKLVELYDTTQKFNEVVATITTMQRLYAPPIDLKSKETPSSPWIVANQGDTKSLEDAKKLTEKVMHRFGTMFHSRGQKIKMPELEADAAVIYTMYLASFETAEAAYEIRYYLADIQMAEKKYAQASSNFIIVAKQQPTDGKFLKDAAFNAVDAISSLNATSKFAPVPPPGQAPSALDIPNVKVLYADTIDFYVKLLPNEAPGLPMRFTAAQIYFDYGHYPEAVKRYDDLAQSFGQTKQGQVSARTVIAYFNEKSDWSNVVAFGKKYQKNKGVIENLAVKKFIDDSLRLALFNSAVASEKSGDYTSATNLFLDFQKLFPTDQNADRALYNAALDQFKAGAVNTSIATQKNMLTQYPKSALGPDVTANLAETYEALAQFQNAAATYRKFAANYPNDKRAPISLYNAGILYRGIKHQDLAATAFAELYRRYPNHQAANDAMFEGAKIKESNQDLKGALTDYQTFATSPANKDSDLGLAAMAKAIEIKLKLDANNTSARKDLNKIVSILLSKNHPMAPGARYTVSRILFNDQEPLAMAFRSLPLNNAEKIEQQAAAKQAKLEMLANGYQQIIAIGNAEFAVASYYRLGELHEDFARALFEMPAPSNVSQKEAGAFKSQLDKAAFPLKDEAYKFFETAYRNSSDIETFTQWTQKTYQKMVQLAPQNHPALDEISASPGYMSYKVTMNQATNSLSK